MFSAEDRARLARISTRAVSLHLKDMGLPHNKSAVTTTRKTCQQKNHTGTQSQHKFPEFSRKPGLQQKKLTVDARLQQEVPAVHAEPVPPVQEIEMTREECFSATMDILLEGMAD